MKRFIKSCLKLNVNKEPFLSTLEMQESKNALLSLVQRDCFPESAAPVHGLLTERDKSGLLRLKTKILERDDAYAFKYPILLPSKHHVVNCLVMEYHLSNSHAGIQALMAILREEYWIISSRRTIRRILNNCVRCKRFTAKAPLTDPIHLPLDRVRDAAAFEITGIDLCGPLILKNKTKSWVVLFTCAIYRAVHLELVTSVSTECFLRAFRRFISRRGRPAVIYSDNGTNFVGMSTAMRKINWEKVVTHQTLKPIQWKFIPPTAAWWGGWWERLIRSTKELLVRVLGRSSVNYEELCTILCDVEAVLNDRPLTYVSDDISDLTPFNTLKTFSKSGDVNTSTLVLYTTPTYVNSPKRAQPRCRRMCVPKRTVKIMSQHCVIPLQKRMHAKGNILEVLTDGGFNDERKTKIKIKQVSF